MIKYSEKTESIELLHEIKWIAADETRDFKQFFKLPIVRYEDTVGQLREFYIWRNQLHGGTQISEVYSKLDEVLSNLVECGEEPDNLLSWISSTKDSANSNDVSRNQWHKYFKLISQRMDGSSKGPVDNEIMRIALSYMKSVDSIYSEFHNLSLESEKNWLQSSQNRTAFDNLLWETHYSQFDMSPVGMQRVFFKVRLQKIWWSVEGLGVANEVNAEMYYGLTNMGANNTNWRWQETHPIDQVFGTTE